MAMVTQEKLLEVQGLQTYFLRTKELAKPLMALISVYIAEKH